MEPEQKPGSDPCGSEPARESVMASNRDIECDGLFASRLAPTLLFGNFRMKHLLGACALLSLLAGCASTDIIDPHGYDQTGVASYYGAKHHGKRTASGEAFNQNALTAAHRQLPFGTRVKVTNLKNDESVVVRINDRGPHTRGRLIDVSRKAAEQLGMLRSGTARVRVQALDD